MTKAAATETKLVRLQVQVRESTMNALKAITRERPERRGTACASGRASLLCRGLSDRTRFECVWARHPLLLGTCRGRPRRARTSNMVGAGSFDRRNYRLDQGGQPLLRDGRLR